jgi:glycosyltransferase involved in cell wall biosynthesis
LKYPKISVVTPSFNQGDFLEETINSVIGQNYPNLEYIIIDGGSCDNSIEIIKKYESRISYWTCENDNGMYDAIQKGFHYSTGEIMTWINSDDLLSTGCLFTVAQIFSDYGEVEWLNGIPNQINEEGRSVGAETPPIWNKYRYLQIDFKYIQQEGMFWRRSLWERAGGFIDEKLCLAGDLELWSRFFMHAELYYVNSVLGTFRMRNQNQKSLEHLDEYNREAQQVLSQLPASVEEKNNLRKIKSPLWKLAQRRPFRFTFQLLNFDQVRNAIWKRNPTFYYNRFAQRFVHEREMQQRKPCK